MKNQTLVIAFVLVASIMTPAFATQNAIVTLRIDPDHLLIGLDAMVSLTVTNIGTEPLQLAGTFRIRAVNPDGTSVVLTDTTGEGFAPDLFAFAQQDDSRLQIPMAHTETFYLRTVVTSPTEAFRPTFFNFHHFETPGQYLLRTELLTKDPVVSFLSGQVMLRIEEPKGRDAEVLALIRAAEQNDHSTPMAQPVAREILTRYSDSSYAPYVVVDYHTTDEVLREAFYKDAIQRAPESYGTELRLALLTWDEQTLMGEAIDHFDLPTALAYREKVKTLADGLSESRFPYAVSAASAALDALPTAAQLQRQYDSRVQRFSAPSGLVSPFVQCVDRGTSKDDPMITIFGYDSPNSMGKYIPVGALNRLRPDDATAQLPTYFGPGHTPHPGSAFPLVAVTRHDQGPSWSLDGGVASVTSATPPCPPQQTARLVTPLFDCLSKKSDGDKLTADFGYINPNPVPVRIQYGPTNAIAGSGTPPTVFLPGEYHGVFTIKGKKDATPAWTLQGQTVAASSGAIQCAADHGDD